MVATLLNPPYKVCKTTPGLKFSDHFLTSETKQDIIIGCNSAILACAWMREYCLAEKVRC